VHHWLLGTPVIGEEVLAGSKAYWLRCESE